jgi:F-type H+-transporting ATPase subunit a
MAEHADPLSADELIRHVQDADYLHLPGFMTRDGSGHVYLPQPLAKKKTDAEGHVVTDHHGQPVYEAVWAPNTGIPIVDDTIKPLDLKLTKFMVLEVVVAFILCVLFITLARKMKGGRVPRGRLWQILEAMVVYMRDYVARPAIGSHDADRFMPLIWTIFFFVLGCNLMGILPWFGTPTGALGVTAALALVAFLTVILSGMKKLGPINFWKAQVPHMDLPKPIAIFLIPLIFGIEVLGLGIKHFVLAIRLWANMTGGHIVLAVLMAFIAVATSGMVLWLGVTSASLVGAFAITLLEVLVAFIQAYIFAFLTSLFIGMAVHPH